MGSRQALKLRMTAFSIHAIPANQPLFPDDQWYCVLEGSVCVKRFVATNEPDDQEAEELDVDAGREPFSMPPSFNLPVKLKTEQVLLPSDVFQGGEVVGPLGDGWFVTGSTGTTLLTIPLAVHRTFVKQSAAAVENARERWERAVTILHESMVLQTCPAPIIR